MSGAYTWEELPLRWPGDPGAPGGRANRVGFAYRAYVPGPVARYAPSLPAALAADLHRAERAAADLERHAPRLQALAWPLLRAEALASSRIEGLAVSHARLARVGVEGEGGDATAGAVLRNLASLRAALDAPGPVRPATLDDIHRALLAGTAQGHLTGRVRTVQNWIGGRHPNPRGAAFVPPPPERVPALLEDLCRFVERDDLPPVLQAAVAHVQFESIHPYADGNGRVGRALTQLVLRRRGVTRTVLPPVSLVLAADPDAYIAGMQAFRRGRAEEWSAFFAEAVWRASRAAEDLAAEVAALQDAWRVRAGAPRRDSASARLIAALPAQPVLDAPAARALVGGSDQSLHTALRRLEAAGVLVEVSGRRRGRLWEAAELFALLDRVEERLGR